MNNPHVDLIKIVEEQFRAEPDLQAKKREVRFLAKVFAEARISDQHHENLRFDRSGQQPPIISIDMEVWDQPGDMLTEMEIGDIILSEAEQRLITEFRASIRDQQIPYRCLPAMTQQLAILMVKLEIEPIVDRVVSFLIESQFGGPTAETIEQIREQVKRDLMNRDIPMFTIVGTQVFYGLPGGLLVGNLLQ